MKMSITFGRYVRRMSTCRHMLILSTAFNGHVKRLHTSTSYSKEKKIFYNRYIKQMKNNQIYTGFAQEIFEKQQINAELDPESINDQDYEQEILNEARKRRSAYKYSQMMQDITKGPGPRYLTWDQMEHVRFLKQTSPEEWTVEMLAHSFQVSQLVIKKVLRSRRVPSKEEREKLDEHARKAQNRPKFLPSAVETKHRKEDRPETKSLTVTGKNDAVESVDSWGLENSGWFREYQTIEQNKKKILKKKRSSTVNSFENNDGLGEVEWLDDEETQFYLELFLAYDEELNADSDMEEPESDFGNDIGEREVLSEKVEVCRKGDLFYDKDGEFLYKV